MVKVLLARRYPQPANKLTTLIAVAAVVAGAGLVATTAAIHLHLWLAGYRHVPRIGPLFLAQAVAGLLLAPVLAVGRHLVLVMAAAIYMAASAVGLLLSATVGFLGIHDGLGVPWATTSLVVELSGFVLLGVTAALASASLINRR